MRQRSPTTNTRHADAPSPRPSPGGRGRRRTHRRSHRGADGDLFYRVADMRLELVEIVLEALGDLARHVVIGVAVRPGGAGIEHAVRHLRATLRHVEAEMALLAHRRRAEPAVERGTHQGAGMGDRHALPDAVGAARPAGIDEPALRLVAGDALAEHPGV